MNENTCIKRYPLSLRTKSKIELPYKANITTVVCCGDKPTLFARVRTDLRLYSRKILCLRENEKMPDNVDIYDYEYLDTIVVRDKAAIEGNTAYTYYIDKQNDYYD